MSPARVARRRPARARGAADPARRPCRTRRARRAHHSRFPRRQPAPAAPRSTPLAARRAARDADPASPSAARSGPVRVGRSEARPVAHEAPPRRRGETSRARDAAPTVRLATGASRSSTLNARRGVASIQPSATSESERLGDRVPVHPEVIGEVARRRQGARRGHLPAGDRRAERRRDSRVASAPPARHLDHRGVEEAQHLVLRRMRHLVLVLVPRRFLDSQACDSGPIVLQGSLVRLEPLERSPLRRRRRGGPLGSCDLDAHSVSRSASGATSSASSRSPTNCTRHESAIVFVDLRGDPTGASSGARRYAWSIPRRRPSRSAARGSCPSGSARASTPRRSTCSSRTASRSSASRASSSRPTP